MIDEQKRTSYQITKLFSVEGKNAIVTGGSRGLGCEMAAALLENGCNVMVVARNAKAEKSDELIKCAKFSVSECFFCDCDITDSDQVKKIVARAMELMGSIDILANVAGGQKLKMLEDMDDETWRNTIELNLTGTFIVSREVIREMRKKHYGKIINISSMKSVFGVSDGGYSAYCASKAGVSMLTKQLACETAADGITVNAIAPTTIRTQMNDWQLSDPVYKKKIIDRIPVGRIGEFRDLAALTLLLASDASAFITGQTILLDGGIAARQ